MPFNSFGQHKDSYYLIFKEKLKKNNSDKFEEKAWSYSDSAFVFLQEKNYDLSLDKIKKSEKYNSRDSILKFWNLGLKGIVLYRKDDYKKSLKYLNKAIAGFKINNNKQFLFDYPSALFYQYKGRNLSDIGLSSSAINNYLKSNIYLKKIKYESKIFENYKFIGRAYQKNGLTDNKNNLFVKGNYLIALKGFKKLKEIEEIAWMYLVLSDFFNQQGQTNTALNYLDSCYVVAVSYKFNELIPITLNNYGEIYIRKNNLSAAQTKLMQAVNIYKNFNNVKNLQITYYNLSELYLKKRNINKSLEYIDSAIFLAENGNNELNLLKFYKYKKGLLMNPESPVDILFDKYLKLNDKILRDKQENIIYAYREFFQSETLKKEKRNLEIKNKQKDERFILLITVSSLLFVIFSGAIILIVIIKKRKEEKNKIKFQNLQLQSVQAQLFPHLLFNTASAAGSVIYKEKREVAYDYLVKMSQLMRKALTDTKRSYKSIEEELDFTENYLQIQKIRFPERFDYTIKIGNNVDTSILVPQMIIQTYVENAVKYGLEPLKEGGLLQVSTEKINNKIVIIVEDNGIGIKAAKKLFYKGTGSGIKIMNEIYRIHNLQKKNKISFRLINLYEEGKKGTKVIIKIDI